MKRSKYIEPEDYIPEDIRKKYKVGEYNDETEESKKEETTYQTDYTILCTQALELIKDTVHPVSNMANISALLYSSLDDINWAGFYLLKDNKLFLGPFQGKVACTEIELGKGVCGNSAQKNKSLLVDDVRLFKGHIACDSASRSEIVIPFHDKNEIVAGVLDIDSASLSRFNENDKNGLEQLIKTIEPYIA